MTAERLAYFQSWSTFAIVSVALFAGWGRAQPPVATADGFATGVTGGADGEVRTVSTAAGFKSACESQGKLIIVVDGNLGDVGVVSLQSDKTLIGKDTAAGYTGNLSLSGVSNIIIQNLTIKNPGGVGTSDGVEASMFCNKIFVTKCTFIDCRDGSFDMKRGSDSITVSWCRFIYPTISGHNFPNLISHSDGNGGQDRGKLHVTMHHNWYDDGSTSRMPRVRFGSVHVYNNYYGCKGNNYIIGIGNECHIRTESCYFDNVNRAWNDMGGASNGEFGWKDHKFVDTEIPTFMDNTYPVFDVPYAYVPDDVEAVKSIVTDAQTGAGNVLGSTTAVTVSASHWGPGSLDWSGLPGGSKLRIFDLNGRQINPHRSFEPDVRANPNHRRIGAYVVQP